MARGAATEPGTDAQADVQHVRPLGDPPLQGVRVLHAGPTTSRGKRIYRCSKRHAGGLCPSPARIFADVIEQDVERGSSP